MAHIGSRIPGLVGNGGVDPIVAPIKSYNDPFIDSLRWAPNPLLVCRKFLSIPSFSMGYWTLNSLLVPE